MGDHWLDQDVAVEEPRAPIVAPREVYDRIASSGRPIACFLDFDGTLVDIVERYDEVVVPEGVPSLLGRLSEALGGAVGILSGRSIADLDRYLSPLVLPGCGQHGLELRLTGQHASAKGSALVLDGIRDAFCELPQRMSGVRIEDKGLTVALHYRERPEAEAELMALAETVLAEGLTLRRGKSVIEIGLSGATKGLAVAALMKDEPFVGRMPVMFGDDLTDEYAFRAVRELDGIAVAVGHRVAASADVVLEGPEAVRRVLEALAGEGRP